MLFIFRETIKLLLRNATRRIPIPWYTSRDHGSGNALPNFFHCIRLNYQIYIQLRQREETNK